MFCEKCGTALREGAKFCPGCGLLVGGAPTAQAEEYSYETLTKLFPWNAVVPIVLLLWLPFTGIGILVALIEGFWFVPIIMSGLVLFGIFAVAWMHKGKKEKWGVNRTLWVFTPEGYAAGYPPDVAKRLGAAGAASAALTFGRQNWGVTVHGLDMAKNLATVVKGLPIMPWTAFVSAEYRPEKREIAMHTPTGATGLILANPDNYQYVEQLVRGYMG